MAGIYADVPGRRFAYDLDGTLVRTKCPDGTMVDRNQAFCTIMNDEANDASQVQNTGQTGQSLAGTYYLTFIFPETRSIAGYFADYLIGNYNGSHVPGPLEYSTNTTDGSDGTWTQFAATWTGVNNVNVPTYYRTSITTATISNIKGIRFGHTQTGSNFANNLDFFSFLSLHLYGTYAGATTGLRFWDPTVAQELTAAALDFGDLAQGTITTAKQFRIKNNNTLTANNTTISAVVQGTSDNGMATGLQFSADNTTFTNTITLTTLAAGATSSVLYVRRTVGAAAASLARSARIQAVAASFS